MKKLKLTKLIASTLVVVLAIALSPIPTNAEWRRDNQGLLYTEGNSYVKGWKLIDGNWYYFCSSGYMLTNNWLKDGDKWYYFNSNGTMAHDALVEGYYLGSDGARIITFPTTSNELNFTIDKTTGAITKYSSSDTTLVIPNTSNSNVFGDQVADENCDEGHSINEVINKWTNFKPIFNEKNIFEEEPSTKAPYEIGKVKDEYLNDTLNYLNFARYLAYLEPVNLDSELTTQAQYGAVLTTVNNKLEHTNPDHPIDMSDDFYEMGEKSTSSSNLSSGNLFGSIQSCLNDDCNLMGLGNIGHREWLLDPKVTKIGFGTTSNYSTQNLPFYDFDDNVDKPDYLAWPSKGAFPNNLINRAAVWSLNLNKDIYDIDDEVSVKITRLCDNKQWDLPEVDSFSKSTSGFKILSYDGYGFGIDSYPIIFHIGTDDLPVEKYLGKYTVKVSGFNKDIEYTINFFNFKEREV